MKRFYSIFFGSLLLVILYCTGCSNKSFGIDGIKWNATYKSVSGDISIYFYRDSTTNVYNAYIYQEFYPYENGDSIFRAQCLIESTPDKNVFSILSKNPAVSCFENYEISEKQSSCNDSVKVKMNFPNMNMDCILMISFDYKVYGNPYKYNNKVERMEFKHSVSFKLPAESENFYFAIIPVINPFKDSNSVTFENFCVPYATSSELYLLRGKGIKIEHNDINLTFPSVCDRIFTLWNISNQYIIVKPSCIYWLGNKFELCKQNSNEE